MTERSTFWAGLSTGDAALITDDDFTDFLAIFLSYDRREEGILDTGHPDYSGGLIVNGGAGSVTIQTGVALVDGKPYYNSAAVVKTVDTPSLSTRTDRVVLRKDFAAQEVRIYYNKNGSEGTGVPPSLVQTDGTTWDIPLATVTVTTGGVITVVNEGVALRAPNGPGYQFAWFQSNLDNTQVADDWNEIGSGIAISCGPGKWLITGQIGFHPQTTTGIRAARVYDNTAGAMLSYVEDEIETDQLALRKFLTLPPTVEDFTVLTQLRLQFFAKHTGDVVNGSASGVVKTSICAIRVI